MDNGRSKRALRNKWDNATELESVRVFAAVAELKSFRGASDALGLPRSTVSRRLADLEAALGTRLLQRTTRQVSLTAAGEVFLTQVAPALEMIGNAGQRLRDGNAAPRGLVRLTASAANDVRIGTLMLELIERHPDVRIELDFSDRAVDLVGEGFDLALRAGRLADSSLIALKVTDGESGYFASPKYLEGRKRPTHPDQLGAHECIVFTGNSRGPRWQFVVGNKEVALPITGRILVNSLAVARVAALRGHGITWLPLPQAAAERKRGNLVPVLEKFWPRSVPVQLLYPSARNVAPQVRAAVELLAKRLAEGL